MGNLVDSIEAEDPPTDSDSEPGAVDLDIIDLDAPEYHEYLKEKRRSLSEGALLNDISYLEWRRNNNKLGSQANLVVDENNRTPETKRKNVYDKTKKRRSTPITGNELLAVKTNSEEYEKRALDSKQRIEDTKKKYNIKDRDYNARTYVWNEQDEQEIKKEREQRKLLRQQIRLKYKLPTPNYQRTTVVATR